ncbi:MAG TPA: FIST N-terminal domain-containing protein [Phycisphaerae bacterium]|nr:FIST N-terminal domain-containing protein [Phycisphaerae bacterium]
MTTPTKTIWVVLLVAAGAIVWLVITHRPLSPSTEEKGPICLSGGHVRGGPEGFAGCGWSIEPDTKNAVREAFRQSGATSDAKPSVTFIFYTSQHSPEAILQALSETAGSRPRVCGWTSDYGVVTSDGYHTSPTGTVGCLSLRLPGMVVGVGGADFSEETDPPMAAKLAFQRAVQDAGQRAPGRLPSMIILSSTHHGYEEEILQVLDAQTGGTVPVMGGTATGIREGSLIANDRIIRQGLTVAVFYADLPFAWAIRGGFDRTSKWGVITQADGRVVFQIDGRPALDVYDEWSGGRIREAMSRGEDISRFTGLYPLCRLLESRGKVHNLFVHAWPPPDPPVPGALQTSADLHKGDVVYFSEGSWNILLNRIAALPRLAQDGPAAEVPTAAALFVFCEAVLKNIPPDQRDQIVFLVNRSLGGIPWIGMFTWGEEGNFSGFGNRHGNLLTSITLFPGALEEEH